MDLLSRNTSFNPHGHKRSRLITTFLFSFDLFPTDLARAFEKLVHEKMAAERVLKATTALEDMADVEALEAHLQNMSSKSEVPYYSDTILHSQLRKRVHGD